jgi:RNA polymerase sigma-70 factor (ECF subfamily)
MPSKASISPDLDTIQRVLNGEVNAYEYLMTKYLNHVTNIVYKHIPQQEVEEVVQNVFVRVYKSLKTFKHKSGFKPWLSAIAVRACYDHWRKVYRSKEVPISSLSEKHQEWLEGVLSEESSQADNNKKQQKKARKILDWGLGHLSPEDRMVMELVYLEGLSGKEAAKLLGWSVANVKVRSFRARKKLHKLLARLDKG